MTSCLTWLMLLAGAVFVMISIIRWFEQITEAVEEGRWSRVGILLAAPLTVWLFPSKVCAGRPTAVPLHEPVRGFGTSPLMPQDAARGATRPAPRQRHAVDPEMIAKLKQKMRQQGMLDNDDSDSQAG
ncbi:hypothetical protein [Fontivita pretiosa]|uniref:hypothetical protein n=1 Tax=Fontivita pretiosa TaxID=2989684 RepID=UPI003D168180